MNSGRSGLDLGRILTAMVTPYDETGAVDVREAARALGLGGETGTLEAGKRCDLAIWNIERPAELVYRIGFNPLHARIWSGK